MNVSLSKIIAGLVLGMCVNCSVHAGLLESTCNVVYEKLNSGPNTSLVKSNESFSLNGKTYRGCVIRQLANAKKVKDTQSPDGLFGNGLLYCPDGKMPTNLPLEFMNKDGWCGDHMADGPDGTYYVALKDNVICSVGGSWDGGNDTDPNYIRSTKYEVTVKCANK